MADEKERVQNGTGREEKREKKDVLAPVAFICCQTSAFLLQPDGITLPWCHQAITSLSHGNYLSSAIL